MPRTKTGPVRRKRHKKVLKRAKGFRGTNRRLFKRAHEAVLHSGQYAYIGRKLRKRDFRKLWIMRINAALKKLDKNLKYSRFIHQLKKANVRLNRKMLAQLAVNDPQVFKTVVDQVQK
ncbi:MAG: 50S ribosomal protein L20 [Candidatus Pacebacteria bacterium]|nr:50S ribosomal protein L20 [Candidatus Paceibacterota bacterium]